jgi:hypothetical protein
VKRDAENRGWRRDWPQAWGGREAEVFAWGADAVLKLYRPGLRGYEAEALALAALSGHAVAPRLIGTVEQGGRSGVVLERVRGADMLSLLRRQPLRVAGLRPRLAGVTLPRWVWLSLQAGAVFGLLFGHWLIFQSLYEIGALCPYCMVVWVVMITVFW